MERYEAYKYSGVEWIGEIPEEWETLRLKNVALILRGGSPRPIEDFIAEADDPNSFNWIKIGDTEKDGKYIRNCKQKIIADGCAKSRAVHRGDLLLTNSMSFGRPYILELDGYIHDGWVCFANIKSVSPEYLYYCLLSEYCTHQFDLMVDGGVVKNLNVDKIGSATIFLPSQKEQQAIADYLDAKTAEVDALVADCEREVGLLREYRKAVISEAVTKGLDPDAPMKRSGSKWVSEIPENWDVIPLKHFSKLITDGVHQTPEYTDEGIPFLSIKDMSNGTISFEDRKYISYAQHLELSKHAPIEEGDLLFARIGTLGVTVVVKDCPTFDIFVSLGLIKLKGGAINGDYLAYCMNSDYYCSYIQTVKAGGGTAAAKYNLGEVSRSPIIQPPPEEQEKIVAYLDAKTAEIDSLIEEKQEMADKLREYRKSLISEAVTGKFKVPGV